MLLILDDLPGASSVMDRVIADGHLGQTSAATHRLALLDHMCSKLTLIGHP